jgi:hypothetical protein
LPYSQWHADQNALDDQPKLNLIAEEKRLFGQIFKQAADKTDTGVVTGDEGFNLFVRSKLPQDILGEIWAIVDPENRGFLTQESFVKALRLIGQCQAQPGRQPDPNLALQRMYSLNSDNWCLLLTCFHSWSSTHVRRNQHDCTRRTPRTCSDSDT